MRKIAAVMVLVLLMAVPAPRSADAGGLLWLLIPLFENALNRKATEPMDRSTSECRVTANAAWQGKTYGMQFDLTKWVIGVRAGATVNLDAVLVGKPGLVKMVAAEVHCNDPDFRPLKAIAMPQPDRRGTRRICPDTLYVTDSGCIFPVNTRGMEFKGYTLQVDLYFNNGKKQAGFFGTERIPYSDSTRTLVQLVVMDDQQITQSVNDPEIQKALQWSFGLQPAVPQLAPANIPLSDEITGQQGQGTFTQPRPEPQPRPQPSPQYQAPQPQPAPQYQPPQTQQGLFGSMPAIIERYARQIGLPGGKPWYESQSWDRPAHWTPEPMCSAYAFFITRSKRLVSGTVDEPDVICFVNGQRQDGVVASNSTNVFPDGTTSQGVIHMYLSPNSDIELKFKNGPSARFRTSGASTILWQPCVVER